MKKYKVVVIHNEDDDIKGEYTLVDDIASKEKAKEVAGNVARYLLQTFVQVCSPEEPVEVAVMDEKDNIVYREAL